MSRMRVLETIYTYHVLRVFFFFQAEDGIRDYKVTGVQTCALPIFAPLEQVRRRLHADHLLRFGFAAHTLAVVIEALRVEARLASVDAATLAIPQLEAAAGLPQRVRAWFGAWREVPLDRKSVV